MDNRYQTIFHGLPRSRAELFGKPNVGAHYTHGANYELDQFAQCVICGRPATNAHHIVPRSVAKVFTLDTELGSWQLRSPLFALCGSGTTGCHNDFHGGARYLVEWSWNSPSDEASWWSGELLTRYAPHDSKLYQFGCWHILDKLTNRIQIIG